MALTARKANVPVCSYVFAVEAVSYVLAKLAFSLFSQVCSAPAMDAMATIAPKESVPVLIALPSAVLDPTVGTGSVTGPAAKRLGALVPSVMSVATDARA